MTIEQIESIKFMPTTHEGWYRLKNVKVTHPECNVAGLIRIGDEYYKKEYFGATMMANFSQKRSRGFEWSRFFKNNFGIFK